MRWKICRKRQRSIPRQLLRWEKELLGVYVTGRPVERYAAAIAQSNPHVLHNLLRDGQNGQDVRVAGEILSMRRVLTRSDNTMCVMQLECWHESAETIELVIFPRTWQQLQAQFEEAEQPLSEGDIVLVIGRYETGRGFNGRRNRRTKCRAGCRQKLTDHRRDVAPRS